VKRYSVDHRAGRSGRDAVLVDEQGRVGLRLSGAWAVTNDDGRTELFVSPDLAGIARAAAVSGMVSGLLGLEGTAQHYSPNRGDGLQTVKRAKVPMRGVPVRWTPMATVTRDRSTPGQPDAYRVELHEAALAPVTFAQQADPASLAGYANGFADPRYGVYDLLHADGRPILRHWATIDERFQLTASVFDVVDEGYPLPEAVILCLARVISWQT
jgi:hypothetical protein